MLTLLAQPADTPPKLPAPWPDLVARHSRRVWVALLAAGAPPHLADELVQETWARLIQRQQAGQLERLELPGLAIRQAQFLWQDERRRQQRADSIEPPPGEPTAAPPEQGVLDAERMGAARTAVRTMPASTQRVFEALCRDPDATHAEIAAQVNLSTQRVKQIVCEMRRRLRELAGGNHER